MHSLNIKFDNKIIENEIYTVSIDHHPEDVKFFDLSLVDITAPATGFMVWDFLMFNRYDKLSKNFYSKAQKSFIKMARKNKKKYMIVDTTKDNKQAEQIIFNKFNSLASFHWAQ